MSAGAPYRCIDAANGTDPHSRRLRRSEADAVIPCQTGGQPRRIGFTAAGHAVVANESGWIGMRL